MGRNQVDASLLEVVIEAIAVIRPVANEMLGVRLPPVAVEAEWDQGDFMMIRRRRTDGERETMAIHNRENFHAFAAFREPDGVPATLGRRKGCVDETLPFIDRPFVAQRVRQRGQHLAQDLLLTPLLESAMDSFVIRVALRQEVPLGAGVQNPEHRFQDGPGGDWFAAWARVREMFCRKMVTNPFPLVIAQPQHDGTYKQGTSCRQLF